MALCREYFLEGNIAQVARRLGVRYYVALRASKELWFEEELASLDRQAKIQQKARLAGMFDKALIELEDRLENGDEVVTKDGVDRVKVKARDLAAIAAMLSEKKEKLDEATKPVGSSQGKLIDLATALREKGKAESSNAVEVTAKRIGNGA